MKNKDLVPEPLPIEGVMLPSPVAKVPLEKLISVRREMGKVYRLMRNGSLPTDEGSRLIYALREIGKLLELERLETRITVLERQLRVRS